MPTATDSAVVNKMVDLILSKAIENGAPSIRIEPTEKTTRVLFQIGDTLRLESVPPRRYYPGILARLKSMAKIDSKAHKKPQEGELKVRFESKDYRIRATFPADGNSGTTILHIQEGRD